MLASGFGHRLAVLLGLCLLLLPQVVLATVLPIRGIDFLVAADDWSSASGFWGTWWCERGVRRRRVPRGGLVWKSLLFIDVETGRPRGGNGDD